MAYKISLAVSVILLILSVGAAAVPAQTQPSSNAVNIESLNQRIQQTSTDSFLPEYKDPAIDAKHQPSFWMLILKIFAQLLLVLGIIYLSVIGLRYFMANRTIQASGHKLIKVLESHYLSQKQAIHLIEIGGQFLLIGSSEKGISYLAELTDETVKQRLLDQSHNPDRKFNKYLQFFMKNESADDASAPFNMSDIEETPPETKPTHQ